MDHKTMKMMIQNLKIKNLKIQRVKKMMKTPKKKPRPTNS